MPNPTLTARRPQYQAAASQLAEISDLIGDRCSVERPNVMVSGADTAPASVAVNLSLA